jgi:hypothetical protein
MNKVPSVINRLVIDFSNTSKVVEIYCMEWLVISSGKCLVLNLQDQYDLSDSSSNLSFIMLTDTTLI